MAKSTAVQKREERGVARRREWSPFDFALTPRDFFGTNPFTLMRRMTEEMDRWFSEAFPEGFFARADGGFRTWAPAVDVTEHNGNLVVHADLPGLKPEDVKVEVTEDALILEGERKQEQEERRGGYYRSERHYGQFYREIPLPEGANTEQAKAQFNNGVLEVTVPLGQPVNRRQIPIEANK